MIIKDKTAVVTGASGGIGRAITEKLVAAGARLVLVARDRRRLERLLDDLGGHPHVMLAVDLSSDGGRKNLKDFCQNHEISLLINATGVNEFGLFEQQSQATIADLININLLSPILVCQDLLPRLQQQSEARIINIGSTFGSIGYPGFSTYCASKFGLRGFTESLRRELADSHTQVSYIAPRATHTALNSETIVALNTALGTMMDDPLLVADEVMRVLRKKATSDKYIGWPEKLFVRINALLPRLVDTSLRKQLSIIRRFAKNEP